MCPARFRAEFHFDDYRVNQDPAHEVAGLEYLFANKKDFGGDGNARQKLGSVLILMGADRSPFLRGVRIATAQRGLHRPQSEVPGPERSFHCPRYGTECKSRPTRPRQQSELSP